MEPNFHRTSSAPGHLNKCAGQKRSSTSKMNMDAESERVKIKRTPSQPWTSDPAVLITPELLVHDYISMINGGGIPTDSHRAVLPPPPPRNRERMDICHGDLKPTCANGGCRLSSSPAAVADAHGRRAALHPPATRGQPAPQMDPLVAPRRAAVGQIPCWASSERRHCGRSVSAPAVMVGGSAAAAHDRAAVRRQRQRRPPPRPAEISRRCASRRAPCEEQCVELVTWNLASPNNNPFEFWVR
jgi:hypothetical protein